MIFFLFNVNATWLLFCSARMRSLTSTPFRVLFDIYSMCICFCFPLSLYEDLQLYHEASSRGHLMGFFFCLFFIIPTKKGIFTVQFICVLFRRITASFSWNLMEGGSKNSGRIHSFLGLIWITERTLKLFFNFLEMSSWGLAMVQDSSISKTRKIRRYSILFVVRL